MAGPPSLTAYDEFTHHLLAIIATTTICLVRPPVMPLFYTSRANSFSISLLNQIDFTQSDDCCVYKWLPSDAFTGFRLFHVDQLIKKVRSYIAQCSVLSRALHFTFLADLFSQTPSQLSWEAFSHAAINEIDLCDTDVIKFRDSL